MKLRPTVLAALAIALGLGGAGALSSGCGSTGQTHVRFAARGGGFEHPDGPVRFTTSTGWTVTLTEARAAVGPVYLNTLAPLACEGCTARRGLFEQLSDALVPVAWAHGESHLAQGIIVGQVTHQIEVDALSPRLVDMHPGEGIDAPVRSAELWLYNREGAMRGACIRAAGTATRASSAVRFEASLVMDATLATAQVPLDVARRVRGIPASMVLAEGGSLTVRVDPRRWFDGADFSELAEMPGGADAVRRATLDDNVGRAFANATRASRGVFQVTFTEASR